MDTAKFIAAFEAKGATILAMPPAAHPPIAGELERWVAAQASDRRRRAAAALRDNLIYISHGELIEYCRIIIEKMYHEPTPVPADKKLIWYVGGPTKSSYFISLICYHFAKAAGYRLPDSIVESITYSGENDFVLFMFDDMSYSGSQLSGFLKAFYAGAVHSDPAFEDQSIIKLDKEDNLPIIDKIVHLDLRLGICCITEYALDYLSRFTFRFSDVRAYKLSTASSVKNPYTIHTSRVAPSLNKLLGDQLYTDCLIYFNPFGEYTPCICYFDHKIADPTSTFTNVLLFGIVPPSELNYKFIYGHEIRKLSKFRPFYTQNEEKIDREIPATQFIPFVSGCPPYDLAALARLPYEHVMIYKDSDGHDADDEREWASEYEFYSINSATIPPEKNSVTRRCPKSWYKTFFKGGSRRNRSKKRSTRRHRSSLITKDIS